MSGLRQLLKSFVRQSWPETDADLLIQTGFAPDDKAKWCWRAWKKRNDIDVCTWPQYKVLARLSGRISQIDPDCSEVPRLNGMAKAQWTKSQLEINKAAKAIDFLAGAEIKVMLLKTAALEAMQLTQSTRRITSDIDLMVPMQGFRHAFKLLWENGWRNGDQLEDAMRRRWRNAGVNLMHENGSDVDLHLQPVHLPFLGQERCTEIWLRARSAKFRGRSVVVPDINDLIVITAMQGVRRHIPDHTSAAMWAFDLAEMIDKADIDWDQILMRALRLNGSFALLSCLEYLRNRLNVQVPASATEQLAAQCYFMGEAVSYFAQSPSSGRSRPLLLPLREVVLLGCQQHYFLKARREHAIA